MQIAVIEQTELQEVAAKSGIEKAEIHAATFAPFLITVKELSNKADTINKNEPTALDAKLAREVRLALVKNRTATGKQKDGSKQALLAESNLIQNLHNVVVNISQLVEADLEEIEKYAENKEKEAKAKLAAQRATELQPFGTDITGYDLANMADNVFADLLESQILLLEKRNADAKRLEAEKIAADKAELERQAALKAENERLKAEAEKAEAALAAERKEAAEKLEAQRIETARMAKIEADKAEALRKENAAKLAAIEAENKRIRDEAEKAAKLLKEKQDAERKVEAERLAAEKKAAKAPVKEKMRIAVSSLALSIPDSEVSADILAKFNGFKTWALNQIQSI